MRMHACEALSRFQLPAAASGARQRRTGPRHWFMNGQPDKRTTIWHLGDIRDASRSRGRGSA